MDCRAFAIEIVLCQLRDELRVAERVSSACLGNFGALDERYHRAVIEEVRLLRKISVAETL